MNSRIDPKRPWASISVGNILLINTEFTTAHNSDLLKTQALQFICKYPLFTALCGDYGNCSQHCDMIGLHHLLVQPKVCCGHVKGVGSYWGNTLLVGRLSNFFLRLDYRSANKSDNVSEVTGLLSVGALPATRL